MSMKFNEEEQGFGQIGLYKDKDGWIVNPNGNVFGYGRVSTRHQKVDRQVDILTEYGVPPARQFIDKDKSGKNFNRPAYKRLLHILRKGDIMVIVALDRLGRDYDEVLSQWKVITQDIGCGIHVVNMPMLNVSGDPNNLTEKFITDIMIQLLAYVAQTERENTLERQRGGMDAAKKRKDAAEARRREAIARGESVPKDPNDWVRPPTRVELLPPPKFIGRPKLRVPPDFWEVYIAWKTNDISPSKLYKFVKEQTDMSKSTFYRRLKELDSRYGDLSLNSLKNLILEDEYLQDGWSLENERIDEILATYGKKSFKLHRGFKPLSAYVYNPKTLDQYEAEKEAEDAMTRQEIEEIQNIILEKRQEKFRERFGMAGVPVSDEKRRGRGAVKYKLTPSARQVVSDIEHGIEETVKTIQIID